MLRAVIFTCVAVPEASVWSGVYACPDVLDGAAIMDMGNSTCTASQVDEVALLQTTQAVVSHRSMDRPQAGNIALRRTVASAAKTSARDGSERVRADDIPIPAAPGIVNTTSIQAPGPPAYPSFPAAQNYSLSLPAQDLGLDINTAYLDGASGDPWALFPGPAPGTSFDLGPEVIALNDPTGYCAPGDQSGFSVFNVSVPLMTPYIVPTHSPFRRDAAVIILPGGSNKFLSWTKEGVKVAKWLNSIGISAFILKYRVPSNSIGTQNNHAIDAQRAVSLVRAHAAVINVSASRIGIMGFSAGGRTAMSMSMQGTALYPPVDQIDSVSFKPDFVLAIYGGEVGGNAQLAVPTFMVASQNDPCYPMDIARQIFANIAQYSPYELNELHIFSDGHHGYGDCTLYVTGNEWQPVCAWTVLAQVYIENLIGVQRPINYSAPMTAPPIL